MERKRRLTDQPLNIGELLDQFSETKDHLLRAGNELFQAFRSAINTLREISMGKRESDGASDKEREEIKEVEIK